ncbi:HAD family hydrolase [Halostella sp. JP-L12]|uniref:HAD family hydrolase n=1 Tax=Halostella TaxID=1843185 RepID=UPI000EF79297|nr:MULTISPECIES: HAD family hydrolase [Halostella]NHN47854.1 HAD family hydrolase [Halostella sp. JP-L12]
MTGDDTGEADGTRETASDAATADDAGADPAGSAVPQWDAVFWDIGGVILDVDSVKRGHRRYVEYLVDEYDLDVPVDEAVDAWRTAVGEHFRERDGTEFRSARDGYAKAIDAIVGEAVPEDEWLPRFREVTGETLEPNPGAREALAELAEMDVHVGVISDVDTAEGRHILGAFDVREYFDSVTTSEEVGRTKPDPAMFESALGAAGVPAERSLMIGDRYRHDAEGAAAVGMSAIAYGADDGEAVDYRVTDLREVPAIVRRGRVPRNDLLL